MGKNSKRQKFIPLDKFDEAKTNKKRSEVETPSNENSKKDVKKIQVQDKNEYEEPLGAKLDVSSNTIQQVNNECNLSGQGKSKNGSSLDHQCKTSIDDTKEQNGKMECGIPKSINKNSNTHSEENSKKLNKKKEKKTANLDHNNTNSLDDNGEQTGEVECDNTRNSINVNNNIGGEGNINSNSNKKKKNITSNLDQNISYSLGDKKECEKKSNNINESKSTKKKKNKDTDLLFDQNSKNSSDKKTYWETESNIKQSDTFDNRRTKRSCYSNVEENNRRDSQFYHKEKNRDGNSSFLEEIDEDLFQLSKDFALAHCVAEDLRMGAGIAVDFKRIFGGVGKLFDQNLKIGDVGLVKRHDQIALYMITKSKSYGKPTMETMCMALTSLKNKMEELNLTKLGIPKVGCGLDGLDWSTVKSCIVDIFKGSGIQIHVCVPSKILDRKAPSPLKVFMTPKNLWEMEAQTDIIIFIDLEKLNENDWTDNVINKVDAKYPFKERLLKDVKNKERNAGEVLIYKHKNEKIFCVFFKQEIFYTCVESVFYSKDFKSKNHNYLAIQSSPFKSDDALKHITSIVLIFRSICSNCELWLCGNTENGDGDSYDQYCRSLYNFDNSFKYNTPGRMSYGFKDNYNQSPYAKGRNSDNWRSSLQNGYEANSSMEK